MKKNFIVVPLLVIALVAFQIMPPAHRVDDADDHEEPNGHMAATVMTAAFTDRGHTR